MSTINLHGTWNLESQGVLSHTQGPVKLPLTIPGDNYTALISSGSIPNPFEGVNELLAQEPAALDWKFSRTFTVDRAFLAQPRHFLYLETVDTLATFFLNGQVIGQSETMFVPVDIEVTGKLKEGENELVVMVHSAENEAKARASRLPYPIPHAQFPVQSPHRNLIRKAQCQSGWDWGPCLMTSGIYGKCEIQSAPKVRLVRFWCDVVPPEKGNTWQVVVHVDLDASHPGKVNLSATLGDQAPITLALAVKEGLNQSVISLTHHNPQLWFPLGYGDQPLYPVTVRAGNQKLTRTLGFRTLKWLVKDDEWGRSMTLTVNGIEIFCKGANWIPVDALPSRWTAAKVKKLLADTAAANMNMLRVWGGGIYESEEFYAECDRLGILIWQDFMFACSMYPADQAFLALVAQEATHQVKRLKDHPSLALFCGNNENLGAMKWFDEVKKNPSRYLVDYDRLNEGTLGRVVRQLDGEGRWWPTSPCGGIDDYSDGWHVDGRGDMHYWSVWHEGKSFSAYMDIRPRFCSEFGYQSFPWLSDVKTYAQDDQWNITSPVMEHHQRSPKGNTLILETFSRYFRIPQGFENTLYLSQVQQAWAIKTAVEYWHSLRPICMGTLFWQINDLWPVASWASITYEGKWKLLHHAAQHFYAPLQVLGFRGKDSQIHGFVVNDGLHPVQGQFSAEFIDFDGKVVEAQNLNLQAQAQVSQEVFTRQPNQLPTGATVLRLRFRHGETQVTNTVWLTEPKKNPVQDPHLTLEITEDARGLAVNLSVEKPAFWVALDADDLDGRFDDNGFDLWPGEVKTVRWLGKSGIKTLKKKLRVFHLFSSSQNG